MTYLQIKVIVNGFQGGVKKFNCFSLQLMISMNVILNALNCQCIFELIHFVKRFVVVQLSLNCYSSRLLYCEAEKSFFKDIVFQLIVL